MPRRAAVSACVRPLPNPLAGVAAEAYDDEERANQEALRRVVDYYAERLAANPAALAYLEKRGLADPELLKAFRVGYCDRTLGLRLPQKNRKEGAEHRLTHPAEKRRQKAANAPEKAGVGGGRRPGRRHALNAGWRASSQPPKLPGRDHRPEPRSRRPRALARVAACLRGHVGGLRARLGRVGVVRAGAGGVSIRALRGRTRDLARVRARPKLAPGVLGGKRPFWRSVRVRKPRNRTRKRSRGTGNRVRRVHLPLCTCRSGEHDRS